MEKTLNSKLKVEAGEHAFGRMKVLRHPCLLQYYDGVSLEKDILIVTEPVKPLRIWLSELTGDRREEQVRLNTWWLEGWTSGKGC